MKNKSIITLSLILSLSLLASCSVKLGTDPLHQGETKIKKVDENTPTAYEIPIVALDSVRSSDCDDPFLDANRLENSILFAKTSCVKKIVETYGNDLNQPLVDVFGNQGKRPLEYALEDSSVFFGKDNPALIPALLISLGANPNAITNDKKNTMLDLALNLDYGKYGSIAHYMIELPSLDLEQKTTRTFLEKVISLKEVPLISHLVHRGVNVNSNTRGSSPLHQAIEQELEASSLQLIGAGADRTATNSSQQTPLHRAIEHKMNEAAKALISKGSPLNVQDYSGETSLHVSARTGNAEITSLLIQAGSDLELKDSSGRSPLFVAVESQQNPVVEALLNSNASVSVTDVHARGLVQTAVQAELALRLLRANAPVSQVSQSGETALSVHTSLDHLEVIKALVTRGADYQWKDQSLRTLLHLASRSNALQSANYLIGLGLSAESTDRLGNTPLFELSSVEMLSLLIGAKADINHLNSARQSALLNHVRSSNLKLVTNFLDRGADIGWGQGQQTSYLIELLKYANAYTQDLVATTQLLLRRKIDSSRLDSNGQAAIHLLASDFIVGNDVLLELCKTFRNEGANLSQQSSDKQTLKTLLSSELTRQTNRYETLRNEALAQHDQKRLEELKNEYDPIFRRLKAAIEFV